ncbi:NitT/TauT family transport system ATP-binding protein [Thermocatellispora tengchongensis]|uniref:NitT/TauT family transport system ATP-binding protein n=1 Tax=Thermocatellispora tengchongensis TaxID=1073253 RepID=A0A840P6D6_9ACTN|nr:ABC transporter ATP-binding protein [Thermocatellispora tengchongensis]MBB5134559.1 NitT/TauT family transport system ATP-binding protein [Thermocatellispora tengchongensis]
MAADSAEMVERTAGARQAGPPEGASGPAKLELIGIGKEFHTKRAHTQALSGIDLTIRDGEFVSVIGRSGCGKTTLLRMLAGLLSPSTGQILIEGRSLWNGARVDTSVVSQLGVVFQEANLFPWYSVAENIALPLRLRGDGKAERLARAYELAELVGLGGFERSYPRELSGGMRQRVAIARALSIRPKLLLMDEPFGALDALTRERMNLELQRIALATAATVVFITHDITEAVFLGDRVVHLTPRPGRIRQVKAIEFDRPRGIDVQTEPGFGAIVRDLRHALDEDEGR